MGVLRIPRLHSAEPCVEHSFDASGAARIQGRIVQGQQALRQIRLHIGVSMVSAGVLTALAFEALLWWSLRHLHGWQSLCDSSPRRHAVVIISDILFYARIVFLCLAPLTDDLPFIKIIMGLELLVYFGTYVFICSSLAEDLSSPLFGTYIVYSLMLASALIVIGGTIRAMCCRDATSALRCMWMTVSFWVITSLLKDAVLGVWLSQACYMSGHSALHTMWWSMLAGTLTLVFISQPRLRNRAQEKLNLTLTAKSIERSAAGIAGLVGGCSARAALSQACARFRSVELQALSEADFADNRPNPDLFLLTSPARLRGCDAFVSHSWSDDPSAKWEALQRWRARFVHVERREPRLWIDKCCIDQNNINVDLRCLPIFLSGCRSLLVLWGATYLSRLWCVLEIFTFVHMGGSIRDVEVVRVLRQDREESDQSLISDGFEKFDAGEATCYLADDKEKILSIIRASFGDLDGFNEVVKDIFRNVLRVEAGDLSERARESSQDVCSEACADDLPGQCSQEFCEDVEKGGARRAR